MHYWKSIACESGKQRNSLHWILRRTGGLPVFGCSLRPDLKDVGDVRRLEGRVIEIHGPVKLYDGRAEIILKRVSQITGGSTLIPPMPKNYDVEKQGHYSAGRMRPTKKPAKTYGTPAATVTYGNEADVSGEPRSKGAMS